MILVYEDMKLVMNLSSASLSLVEASDVEAEKADGEKHTLHLISFVFVSGMAKQIAYPNAERRDAQWAAIRDQLLAERREPNRVVPVGLRPKNGTPPLIQL